jgi:hypothetical protein
MDSRGTGLVLTDLRKPGVTPHVAEIEFEDVGLSLRPNTTMPRGRQRASSVVGNARRTRGRPQRPEAQPPLDLVESPSRGGNSGACDRVRTLQQSLASSCRVLPKAVSDPRQDSLDHVTVQRSTRQLDENLRGHGGLHFTLDPMVQSLPPSGQRPRGSCPCRHRQTPGCRGACHRAHARGAAVDFCSLGNRTGLTLKSRSVCQGF